VSSFPHVGIIDPLTGTLLFKKEGWTQASKPGDSLSGQSMIELLIEFKSRHTIGGAAPPSRGDRRSSKDDGLDAEPSSSSSSSFSAAASSAAAGKGTAKRALADLTEEEQLEAALRASLETAAEGSDDEARDGSSDGGKNSNMSRNESGGDSGEDGEYTYHDDTDEDVEHNKEAPRPTPNVNSFSSSSSLSSNASSTNKTSSNPSSSSAQASAQPPPTAATAKSRRVGTASLFAGSTLGPEPAAGGVRVKLNFGGKSVTRRFAPGETVGSLYLFVDQQEDYAGMAFSIKVQQTPFRDLKDDGHLTLEEAKLNGMALMVKLEDA
jgi:hypothetical protein